MKDLHLQKPDEVLKGANERELPVSGMITVDISHCDQSSKGNIYVVDGLRMPVLSRKASEKLGIVKRLDEVITQKNEAVNPEGGFLKLCSDLGKIKLEYQIKLNEDAVPLALTIPRKVLIPLMSKAKAKFQEMVELDVTEPVEDPTQRCSGMVTVQKPDGDVCICIDLTKLNKFAEREIHPRPASEHIPVQLAGAHYFFKVEANSAFWQFKLAEEPQSMTAFIVPFSRYWIKKLPFQISSAPECIPKEDITVSE